MLSTQIVPLRPARTLSHFSLTPFLSLSRFSVILIPSFFSTTFFSSHFSDFCSSSPCGGVKWLWLQLQTLCMLKKDNNLQLVRVIVNFSVLMHLGWPYLCAATRNVNDIPPPLCPKPINRSPSIYTACIHLEITYRADEQLTMKTYTRGSEITAVGLHK